MKQQKIKQAESQIATLAFFFLTRAKTFIKLSLCATKLFFLMFVVVVTSTSANFVGFGKTEKDAVKNLISTRIGFVVQYANSLKELHEFLERKRFRWYVQCKLVTPAYVTFRKGKFAITTFPAVLPKNH